MIGRGQATADGWSGQDCIVMDSGMLMEIAACRAMNSGKFPG